MTTGAGPRVWLLGAGKGGVGTSTAAGVAAVEAGLGGVRTLLIDGEPGLGGLHRLFGLQDGHPGVATLQERGSRPESLLVSVAPNVSLIPSGVGASAPALFSRGQKSAGFRRLLTLFGDYDLVLVDGGATLDSLLPPLALEPSGVLGVTTPDRVAMAGAFALYKAMGQERPGLPVYPVFNRASEAEAEGLYGLMSSAVLRFLHGRLVFGGRLCNDPGLSSRLTLAHGFGHALRSDARALVSALVPTGVPAPSMFSQGAQGPVDIVHTVDTVDEPENLA